MFIGTQVANWNEDRLEKRETQRMLARLAPELRNLLALYASSRTVLRDDTRLRGDGAGRLAEGPKDQHRDFVIAAYQASRIYSTSTNNATWATIFGADRLRSIDDPVIRDNLAFLMYSDTRQIDTESVNTPYRQNVRRVIPVEIQDAIRTHCGDRSPPETPQLFVLPRTCELRFADDDAASAAAALRAHPQLVEDLRWHTAAIAAFIGNMNAFQVKTETLARQIDAMK